MAEPEEAGVAITWLGHASVSIALNGVRPVEFYGRCGGNVPSHEELMEMVRARAAQMGVIRCGRRPAEEYLAYV